MYLFSLSILYAFRHCIVVIRVERTFEKPGLAGSPTFGKKFVWTQSSSVRKQIAQKSKKFIYITLLGNLG